MEDLFDRILMEDILDREGLDYKLSHGASGEQLNVCECPFCGGTEWKVFINRETGLGNCFHGSCQERFNLYGFVKRMLENNGGGKPIAYLKQVAKEQGWRPERKTIVDVETNAATTWSLPSNISLPDKNGKHLPYLQDRGIDAETARFFDLRYCHAGWYAYKKSDGSDGAMNFSRRVIIPIYDIDGDMVTFQGRDITGEADRKYLFPAGLPGTSRFLYNAFRHQRKKHVVLNEGVMDVIATHNALRETHPEIGVIGSFGIELSTGRDGLDQVSRLLDMKDQGLRYVTIMWDGEKGAFQAALKAAKTVRSIGLKARIACLPAGQDPGEADPRDIRKAFDEAITIDNTSALRLRVKTPYR